MTYRHATAEVLEALRCGRQRLRARDFTLKHNSFASAARKAGLVRDHDDYLVPGPTTYRALEDYIARRVAIDRLVSAA